ncbi:hypothetical protein ACFL6I_01175 [candidate division KSB1 bacterium]
MKTLRDIVIILLVAFNSSGVHAAWLPCCCDNDVCSAFIAQEAQGESCCGERPADAHAEPLHGNNQHKHDACGMQHSSPLAVSDPYNCDCESYVFDAEIPITTGETQKRISSVSKISSQNFSNSHSTPIYYPESEYNPPKDLFFTRPDIPLYLRISSLLI